MSTAIHLEAARLVLAQRWAAVATAGANGPLASMVAYAPEPNLSGLIIFVSHLAQHTRDMLATPRVSLAVTAPDTGGGDPQLLPRASLQGTASEITRDSEDFAAAAAVYVGRFPQSAMRFELADFVLLRLVVDEVRFVGGFARATSFSGEELRKAAAQLQ